MSASVASGPVGEGERIVLLDVLRGLAIFGILAVNVLVFSAPVRMPGFVRAEASALDEVVEAVLAAAFVGKFYTLFSLLFGVGFALQLQRAEARGDGFALRYARRLGVLFALGAAHAVLLWEGDILWLYALLGFVLLGVRGLGDRTVLALVGACLIASIGGLWLADRWLLRTSDLSADLLAEAIRIYGSGSYGEIIAHRLATLPRSLFELVLEQAPGALAMFLLGLYVGRNRLFESAGDFAQPMRGSFVALLLAAVAANAAFVYGELSGQSRFEVVGLALGGPLLCLVYVLAVARLLRARRWQARAWPVAAVGRTALTNYLLQSLICTSIFYGYGAGLYNRIGAAQAVALAVGIYGVQLAASAWWLAHFRFGPVEWLWRSLTYGRRQPLRRSALQREAVDVRPL